MNLLDAAELDGDLSDASRSGLDCIEFDREEPVSARNPPSHQTLNIHNSVTH
jgi:hypothetical protein